MALDDYGALQANAGSVIPDPLAQQGQLLNLQGQRIAQQSAMQQMAMQRYALQRQQMFGQDLSGFVQNPTPQGLATLFGKYPEFDKQAAEARSALDRGDIQLMGSAAALAAKGRYSDAGQLMQERADADKAAGHDNTHSAEIASLLNSGDPAKQQAGLGMLSLGVGIAVGPEKASEFLKASGLSQEPIAVGLDQRLLTPQGVTLAGAAPKLEHVETTNADGSTTSHAFSPYTGMYGQAAATGAPPTASPATPTPAPTTQAPGMVASINHVFSNEGGWNPKDANGTPTNMGINFKANKAELAGMGITAANFKNMTRDQAAQIYATKYWPKSGAEGLPANLQAPYFDVYVRNPALAKQALAQSGGDPQKFVQIASAAFQKMAGNPNSGTAPYKKAWATRDAGNLAIATGAAPAPANAQAGSAAQADPYSVGGSQPGVLNTKGAEPGYAWNPSHTAQIPVPGGEQDPNSYAPQEVEDLARNWIITGQPLGGQSGGGGGGGGGGGAAVAGLRKAVMARATQLMSQIGITPDQLPALRSKYKADNEALTNMNGLMSSLEGSENALRANAQQVLKTQQALIKNHILDNGSPILNNLRIGTYEHIGSAETKAQIKAYTDAVNAFQVEYTKFMNAANGMGGSAAPSDASASRAQDLTDTGLGPQTMISHIHQTLLEAQNRKSGMAKQVQTLQQRLSSYLQPQADPLPPGARVIGTHQGKRVVQLSNGKRLVEQ